MVEFPLCPPASVVPCRQPPPCVSLQKQPPSLPPPEAAEEEARKEERKRERESLPSHLGVGRKRRVVRM